MKELLKIQGELKAPKTQENKYGKYQYRSLEDILEAVKPLLIKYECLLRINDEIVNIGDRFFVKAIATLKNSTGEIIENVSYAREALAKKGMDEAQITGATSSYARKYCLNGLFLIDDTRDADTQNNQKNDASEITKKINSCKSLAELKDLYNKTKNKTGLTSLFTAKKQELENV